MFHSATTPTHPTTNTLPSSLKQLAVMGRFLYDSVALQRQKLASPLVAPPSARAMPCTFVHILH